MDYEIKEIVTKYKKPQIAFTFPDDVQPFSISDDLLKILMATNPLDFQECRILCEKYWMAFGYI